MKFLLHSHFPAGHCYPMQAVAQELVSRGHHVVWLTSRDNESRVRAVGAEFVPAKALEAVDGPLARENATGLLDGDYGRSLEGRVLAQVEDYRAAIHGGGTGPSLPDLLLVDVLPHGARALFELGQILGYATLGVIPMYLSSPKAPLPVSGQAPPTTRLGTLKNWLRHVINRWIVLPWFLRPIINRQRAMLGLRALPFGQHFESFTYSPFLHIQASSPTLEFRMVPQWPEQEKHASTVFVGPLVTQLKSPADRTLPEWWDKIVSHPRVIGITQGTLAMDPNSLIIPSIQALADDPKNLLIVVSPHASDIKARCAKAAGRPLGENVFLAEWLPYHLLLPQLRLLITNGGYGSITQALSHSVPLLCAGQTEDKRDTAARVAWSGAGIDLGTDSPSTTQVHEAASRILENDSYRGNAAKLGAELRDLGGARVACDHLEELARRCRS